MTLSRRNPRAGQRWTLLAASVMVLVLVSVAGALAVHDVSVFQLDTPSADAQVDVGSVLHHDDWDVICEQTPTTCSIKPGFETGVTPSNALTALSHVNDGALNASIFSGGGSKDIYGISSGAWAWKDESGGLPDKDNLLHAYAARYSTTPSGECPVDASFTTCELIYFGSDRYANDGDATQAFWFLQNPVSLGTNKVGGATGFSGTHRNGDLLIISEFSNGGTKSTITIYKWVCGGTGNGPTCDSTGSLQFVTGGDGQKCGGASPDPFCGIVNESETPIDSPWPFTDKAGSSQFRQGELFEAGINLSDPSIKLAGECFASFVAETRSATSTSAQLKDFVIGTFQPCGATLSTTPSAGAGGEVSPGTSVTDTLTVQGTGIANPPTPSGNVTFWLCSFAAGSTDVCDGTTTAKTGTQVGTAVALASSAPPPGEAQAISAAVNTSTNPLLPGRYCFRAEWPGDGNYLPPTPPGKFVHFGTGNAECFTVRTIPTTTVTTPSDGSGVALSSPVALGTQLFDKAVVTGTAVGGTPPGTVTFWLCDPTEITGSAGSEVCASGTGDQVGSAVTLQAVSGSTPPAAQALSSPGVAANQAGVWCFRATYTPSGTTYTGSSDNSHGECVTVSKAPTGTVTTPHAGGNPISAPVAVGTSVTDKAVVTGTTAGGTPTGTINFFICSPAQLTPANTGTCSTGGTAAGSKTASAVASSSPPQSEATSDAVTVTSVGRWCFRAEYVPTVGGNYTGSSDSSTTECFVVQDSTSLASEQDWLPNDTATVTAAGGTALNGTLTFTLYETADCTGTAVSGQTYSHTLTNATSLADRTKSTNNTTYLVKASKSVSWKVTFTPTAGSNVVGSTHCEKTQLTITN